MSDELIYFGDAIKAMGNGKVGGYLVRYSSGDAPDLTGDYFNAGADYGIGDGATVPIYYQHGFDPVIKNRRIGSGKAKFDEVGIWLESQLEMRDEYERMIYELAESGKLGWSSGAAGHLVDRKQNGKAWQITSWPIAEASLTPTPAEPRNSAIPLKSLFVKTREQTENEAEAEVTAQSDGGANENQNIPTEEINNMNTETVLTPELAKQIASEAAEAAVKAFRESAPAEKSAEVNIQVTRDEADVPFKSIAENCAAVKSFELSKGQTVHPRLRFLKATGASEGIPSDGGLLLDPTLTSEFLAPVHNEGPFSSAARRLPVSSNSNYGWLNGIDETSRATGSRWGGIRGYRLAEAQTKTASKPTFRRIQWELKKYAVVVYGTDELLADASQFSAVVNQGCREELNFMVNDDILNGLGVAGPQGVMQSGALISATRTDANLVQHADIVAMWNRLDPRGKANAAWYINNEVQPQLDKLYFTGTTSVLSPFVGYRPDGVMTLYGRPVIVTEFNAALGTVGDIVLADMSNYLFWEKGGVEAATSIHVQFLTDETTFRFVYRCDGQSALASALTPYKGTATVSPFVALSTAS